MKVLLLTPPHTIQDRYNKALAKVGGNQIPLGLLYIASYLRENNHNIAFIDGAFNSASDIISKIKSINPEIIGFSFPTMLSTKAKQISNKIKQEFPYILQIAGGPHSTAEPIDTFQDSSFDFVIIGEGEKTIVELIRCIENNGNPEKIKGLAYKKNKKVKINSLRKVINNIDDLPIPAHDLIKFSDYVPSPTHYKVLPIASIITSRGCPYNCIFCANVSGKIVRFRSIKNVIDELKILKDKYKIKGLDFWDDTFTLDKKRVIKLCNEIKKEKLDFSWGVQARVNTIDNEMLIKFKETGCWRIMFGIESGIQKNLDMIKKGITIEQIKNAIEISKKNKLQVEGTFILGIPEESYQEAVDTINFAISLDLDYADFFIFTPLPGSPIYKELRKEEHEKNEELLNNNFEDYTGHKLAFRHKSMTEEQIENLVSTAYRKFYLRPNFLLKKLSDIKRLEDIKKYYNGFIGVLKMTDR